MVQALPAKTGLSRGRCCFFGASREATLRRIRRTSEEGKGRPIRSNKAYCKQGGNQDDGAGTTEEEGSYSAAVSVPPGINRRSAAIKVSTSVASALLLAKNDNCGGVFQAREAKALELSDEDLEITNR
jgi:hypothetical protein